MKCNEVLRRIPSVEQLLCKVREDPRFFGLSHPVVTALLRQSTQKIRHDLATQSQEKAAPTTEEELNRQIIDAAAAEKAVLMQPNLRKVINATGIVLHTNLGRAPLSMRAQAQVLEVMGGYSTLEYDLNRGERGDRYAHVVRRLEELTGAEASLVVNNNAAAVVLTLAGIARGREVLVSRGELVEIGGSFRIPDIIRQSGAELVEVGTTNKTHLSDYADAISANTAAILKVHTSNFKIVGFTSSPTSESLCALAKGKNLVSINDVGSGTLLPYEREGFREPSVQECVTAGFDLVTFSGDKLLGAGQAGIIVGKKVHVDRLRKEPLLRAFRIDKLSLAALEGTLIDYVTGGADSLIPVRAMLNASEKALKEAADELASKLIKVVPAGWRIDVVKTAELAGGGALPVVELPGFGVRIVAGVMSATRLERKLRTSSVPIIGLLREEAVILDMRCMRPGDDGIIEEEILQIAAGNRE